MRQLVLFSFLFLATAWGHEDTQTCSSNVVVMTREDLAQEIQSQIMAKTPSSSISNCNISTTKVTDEIYKRIVKLDKEKLTDLQEALNCPCDTYASCQDILEFDNSSPSGYYWLQTSSTSAEKVYCDMSRICGGVRGWMRLTQLDMTDPKSQCPDGFYPAEHNNKTLCATSNHNGGCPASLRFSTGGVQYSEVCGKVIAYQKGQASGIHSNYRGLEADYIDGVSLTHGPHNGRHHIWTFVATYDENGGRGQCPCTNRNNRGSAPPHYVGLNYFCDTGAKVYQQYTDDFRAFTDNPLWDGAGCGPNNECCTFNTPPWFYRKLHYSTLDSIELRVCRNGYSLYEEILLEKFDLYVR